MSGAQQRPPPPLSRPWAGLWQVINRRPLVHTADTSPGRGGGKRRIRHMTSCSGDGFHARYRHAGVCMRADRVLKTGTYDTIQVGRDTAGGRRSGIQHSGREEVCWLLWCFASSSCLPGRAKDAESSRGSRTASHFCRPRKPAMPSHHIERLSTSVLCLIQVYNLLLIVRLRTLRRPRPT